MCIRDSVQSGPQRFGPDHYTNKLFNGVFGSQGFASRLFSTVRRDMGLAYTTYGARVEGLLAGKNIVYMQTKGEDVVKAVDASIEVLKDLQQEEVSQDVLSNFKRNIQNTEIFAYDSLSKMVRREAYLDFIKAPEDYRQTYVSKINQVTAADIKRVANTWKLDDLIVLVVGPASAYNLLSDAISDKDSSLYQKNLTTYKFDEQVQF